LRRRLTLLTQMYRALNCPEVLGGLRLPEPPHSVFEHRRTPISMLGNLFKHGRWLSVVRSSQVARAVSGLAEFCVQGRIR
jgi:uncharacterized protein YbbK (DUF523 family)